MAERLDRCGIGRVMFRNVRSALGGFPVRELHPAPLPDAGEETRVKWLAGLLRATGGEKLLLICHERERAEALKEALLQEIDVKAGVFHEGLTLLQRDRQDHAIGIIRRLFKGERVTDKTDWYTMQDAALQLLPLQEDMPFVVASQVSPSGMTLAGKHGIGIISIGSMSNEGLLALPTQWKFAEEAAKKHGQAVDRKNWRVLMSWHIAETREQAREDVRFGLQDWLQMRFGADHTGFAASGFSQTCVSPSPPCSSLRGLCSPA